MPGSVIGFVLGIFVGGIMGVAIMGVMAGAADCERRQEYEEMLEVIENSYKYKYATYEEAKKQREEEKENEGQENGKEI